MATVQFYQNVPLTKGGKHRLNISNADLYSELSLNYKLGDSYTVSYVKGGVVEVPTVAYSLIKSNYMSYVQGNEIHFCYVDEVIWTSNRSCAVSFTEDYVTKYFKTAQFGNGVLDVTNSLSYYNSNKQSAVINGYRPKRFTELFANDFLASDNKLDYNFNSWAYLFFVKTEVSTLGFLKSSNRYSPIPTMFDVIICYNKLQILQLSLYFLNNVIRDEDDIIDVYAIPTEIANEIEYDAREYEVGENTLIVRFVKETSNVATFNRDFYPSYISDVNKGILWRNGVSYIELNLMGNIITFSPEDLSDTMLDNLGRIKLEFGIADAPSLTLSIPDKMSDNVVHYKKLSTIDFPKISVTRTSFENLLGLGGITSIKNAIATYIHSGVGGATLSLGSDILTSLKASNVTMGTANSSAISGGVQMWMRWICPTESELEKLINDIAYNGLYYGTKDNIDDIISANDGGVIYDGVVYSTLFVKAHGFNISGVMPSEARREIAQTLNEGVWIHTSLASLKVIQ